MNIPANVIKKAFTFRIDGVRELIKNVDYLKDVKLSVGVMDSKQDYYKLAHYEDVKEIAMIHEYGSVRVTNGKSVVIPARSFIRHTELAAQKKLIPEMQLDMAFLIAASTNKTGFGEKRILDYGIKRLNELGAKMLQIMRLRILDKIDPPLKQVTVDHKKAEKLPYPTTPLIATGTLYQHTNYVVRHKGRFTKKAEGKLL